MKSTGILFQSDMVRAIGRTIDPKTQTRRIIDPKPQHHPVFCTPKTTIGCKEPSWFDADGINAGTPLPCRFGGAGDELWVKETFSRDFANYYPNEPIWYKADDDRSNEIEVRRGVRGIYSPESKTFAPFKWTPSIFCSRDDSRTTLTIDNIRAQRLQEITEQDAIAEGIERTGAGRYWLGGTHRVKGTRKVHECPVQAYRDLWNSINAKPQPVYHRDASGNKYINHYVAYPWELDDMHAIKGVKNVRTKTSGYADAAYRGKCVIIHPNPYVWAITFHRK